MDIGIALPTMAPGYTRATTLDWCRLVDEGPFSSISCGERISFHNQEVVVTNAAAAALTSRVQVFLNLLVGPLHATPVLAKEVATLDVLSDGRVTLGLGVGGRDHDYRAAGAPFDHRHQRLDDQVHELRRLWAGGAPFDGADPVGPPPVQPGGPPILAGAMGPKALARAARWADGVSGFSLAADRHEMARANEAACRAWVDAGRDVPPRVVSGCFCVLGGDDPEGRLRAFTTEYLAIYGTGVAQAMAATVDVATPERLRRAVDDAREVGCDELILVPGTADIGCLHEITTALGG